MPWGGLGAPEFAGFIGRIWGTSKGNETGSGCRKGNCKEVFWFAVLLETHLTTALSPRPWGVHCPMHPKVS